MGERAGLLRAAPSGGPVGGGVAAASWCVRRVGGQRRLWPTGLLDRLRWADTEDRLGRSGLVLAGLVVAVGVEDAFLWGGRCPVRYRRLMAESGYSRSTVARLLPAVLALLAEVGGIVYDREVGEPYRVRVVDGDVLAGRGVGWLPWAAADSSHRLYPEGWSHTDRATYAVWWGWSGWCGDVPAPVNTAGLAARAGLRPSTLRRRPHPAGLWNHRGDRLAVARWEDPYLDTHREQVRYNDYRCSVPARSGLEGATVRWHGHTNQPEPDTASPSVNEPSDDGQLWGGLIAYKPSYTTSARERSSDARPSGDAPRKQISAKRGVVGRGPPPRRRQSWTPERHNYETRAAAGSWAGPDVGWVGSDLARRFGWHVAEQAALEVDRVVRLGRPVQNPRSLATHFARCFAQPQLCHQRHQGACGDTRLNQHRGRRLDEQLETRSHQGSDTSTMPVSAPNPATEPRQTIPVTTPEPRVIDQAQLKAALARLPKPLAAQLARLATRHRITLNLRDTAKAQ